MRIFFHAEVPPDILLTGFKENFKRKAQGLKLNDSEWVKE